MKTASIIILVTLLVLPGFALAVENFVALAPISGVTDQPQLSGFLNAAFRMGVIIAAFLAVIMIAFGGLEYMVSSIPGIKTEGVERIKSALWGLILILFAYIVLKTINPDILNLRFESSLGEQGLREAPPTLTVPAALRGKVTTLTADEQKKIEGSGGTLDSKTALLVDSVYWGTPDRERKLEENSRLISIYRSQYCPLGTLRNEIVGGGKIQYTCMYKETR